MGEFAIEPNLKPEHIAYLKQFAHTRHVKRDPAKIALLPDPLREAVGLPLGEDAEFYVGPNERPLGWVEQVQTDLFVVHNDPPRTQPGLFCHWVPATSADGTSELVWDEVEQFEAYIEWLEYMVDSFFKPWGYVLNGEVSWQGGDSDNRGKIEVEGNEITTYHAVITYVEDRR